MNSLPPQRSDNASFIKCGTYRKLQTKHEVGHYSSNCFCLLRRQHFSTMNPCPSASKYAKLPHNLASKEEFEGFHLYTQMALTNPCIQHTLLSIMALCSVYIKTVHQELLVCYGLLAFNLCCVHALPILVCCHHHVHKEHGSIQCCSTWALGL